MRGPEQFASRTPSSQVPLCDWLDELLTESRREDASSRLRSVPPEHRSPAAFQCRRTQRVPMRHDYAAVMAIRQPLLHTAGEKGASARHASDDRSARYAPNVLLPDDGLLKGAHVLVTGILARLSVYAVSAPLDFFQRREVVLPAG
jgi:hypothetical protein